ncbi:glycosyltransferase [Bacillus thuringiensis]|uniref:glycosyltransferase n=1 Tax=Bacillus thuringiensis TaxID=1428 RepID=UPI003D00C124
MSNYNTSEKYLRESIESILNQSFTDFEFIIIDDCSTNNGKSILKSFNDDRIKVIFNEKNLGLAASLNKALQISKGEFVARMDSDDISLETRLEKQYKYLKSNPSVGLVASFAQKIGNDKGYIYSMVEEPEKMNVPMFFGNVICHPSVMFRKEVITNNHLKYNEEFKTGQDYELWSRLLKTEKVAIIPEVLLSYRIHNNQISNEKKMDQIQNTMKVYSYMLEGLGLEVNQEILEKHHAFCTSSELETFNLKEMIYWGEFIKKYNLKNRVYDVELFNEYVDFTIFKRNVRMLLNSREFSSYILKYLIKKSVLRMNYKHIKSLVNIKLKSI